MTHQRAVSDPSPKSPWLAAVLNLIPVPLPLGHAYLGRWWRFGIFTLVRSVVISFAIYTALLFFYTPYSVDVTGVLMMVISFVMPVPVITAIDAFVVTWLAKRKNRNAQSTQIVVPEK